MKISYYAIFEYAEDGISVTFPDIPNAITCGFNKRHAKKMAKDVLSLVLHGTPVHDLPIAKKKTQILDCCKRTAECVRVSIHMKLRNKVLMGKHVIELTDENLNPPQ